MVAASNREGDDLIQRHPARTNKVGCREDTTNDLNVYNGTSWLGTIGGGDGNGIYDGSGTIIGKTI